MAQQIIIVDKPPKKEKKKPRKSARAPRPSGRVSAKKSRDDYEPEREPYRKGYDDLCLPVVPAPNMYKLKSLVGYNDHDPSKWREPAFSMGKRHIESKRDDQGPGPKYDIGDTTRFGTKNPVMFSLGKRNSLIERTENMPGPSAYSPEKFNDLRFKKPPAASLKGRMRDRRLSDIPSPAEYEAPGGIGTTHPTITATPAAVLMSRRESRRDDSSAPAPNTYGSPSMGVTKKSAPMSSIGARNPEREPMQGPGPGAYNPQSTNARSPPAYSFGTKRSRCIEPFKEPDSAATLC